MVSSTRSTEIRIGRLCPVWNPLEPPCCFWVRSIPSESAQALFLAASRCACSCVLEVKGPGRQSADGGLADVVRSNDVSLRLAISKALERFLTLVGSEAPSHGLPCCHRWQGTRR
jgi:hypothetical protein